MGGKAEATKWKPGQEIISSAPLFSTPGDAVVIELSGAGSTSAILRFCFGLLLYTSFAYIASLPKIPRDDDIRLKRSFQRSKSASEQSTSPDPGKPNVCILSYRTIHCAVDARAYLHVVFSAGQSQLHQRKVYTVQLPTCTMDAARSRLHPAIYCVRYLP
jgi:hypothetical protein